MKYYNEMPNNIFKIISMYTNDGGDINPWDGIYGSAYDSSIVTYVWDYLRRVNIINNTIIFCITDRIV
jgi:hypothetical protein